MIKLHLGWVGRAIFMVGISLLLLLNLLTVSPAYTAPGATAQIVVDRGCGSTYKVGDHITVSYMVSVNSTVTLIDILPNGSQQILISNAPVQGGQ